MPTTLMRSIVSLCSRSFGRSLLSAALGGGLTLSLSASSAPQFAAPVVVSSVHRSDQVVMGDFDGDDVPDVAVYDRNSGDVEVRFGDGAGGFRSGAATFSAGTFNGMAAADLNGDGQSELLFAAHDKVLIYTRQPAGTFSSTNIDLSASGIDATKAAVGDLTSAGSKDIIVADDFGDIGLLWISNDGMGNFGTPHPYATHGCGHYTDLSLADIDGDGLADVSFANSALPPTVSVLLNKGDGTLNAEVTYSTPAVTGLKEQSAVAADVDGDGNPDLVAVGSVHDSQTLNDTYYLSVYINNGNGTFADGKPFLYAIRDGVRIISSPVIGAADFNADGKPDIVTILDVPGTMSDNPFQGISITRFTGSGSNLAVEQQDNFATNFSYNSLALGYAKADGSFVSFNGDTQPDVILGSGSTVFDSTQHGQFAVVQNTTPAIPPGRDIAFSRPTFSLTEGGDLDVTVTRGADSTGTVLAFFTVGGTAVQGTSKDKQADYEITDPGEAQPVTFEEGEHSKSIHLSSFASKTAESAQTIILTLLEPVGDAQLGGQNAATITIVDDQEALIPKPGALSVKAVNVIKPLPVTSAPGVKVAARTGSDWTFSVSQRLPSDAGNPSVQVQQSPNKNIWLPFLTLAHAKGTNWSAVDRHPMVCSTLYFRTVTIADGYGPVYGTPTPAFAVSGGPELGVQISAISDSDPTGATVHNNPSPGPEAITYHFKVTNSSRAEVAGSNIVLTAPVPLHTSFLSATTGGAQFEEMKDKSGKTVAGKWTFASVPAAGSAQVDFLVQVDSLGAFSKSELKKYPNGYGYVVKQKSVALDKAGFNVAAPGQGVSRAFVVGPDEIDTQIIGALKLTVSTSPSTVDPGGLITYTFHCENDSAAPLDGGVVIDSIPAGTVLDTVYAFDGNGNATSTPLPNPGPFTNPAIVYAKTDTTAKIDLSNFLLQELPLLKPIATAKPGRVVNLNNLSADTVKLLIDDGFIKPTAVRWVLGTIPGAGTAGASNVRDVAMTVRVPYDQAVTDASGSPFTIVNSSYDFLVAGANPPVTAISALYNAPAAPLKVTVNNVKPADKPNLVLNKSASGDPVLNNPDLHGNGFVTIAGIGNVVNVAQKNGVDYLLAYSNFVDKQGHGADAHGVVLHDVIPDGMTLRGFFRQDVNGSGYGQMFAGQFTFYDKSGTIIPGVDPNTNQENMALVKSMDIRLGDVSNLSTVLKGTFGTVRYTCEPNITPTTTITYPGVETEGFYALPGIVHSFGGFIAGQGPSGRLQGFYIGTSDQLQPVAGGPTDCAVKVMADVAWDFPGAAISAGNSQPYDIVPFDLPFTQNGDVTATNCVVTFSVPQGVTFLNQASVTPHANAAVTIDQNTHLVADGMTPFDQGKLQPHLLPDNTVLNATQSGAEVHVSLGDVTGHTSGTVRIYFQVNGPTLDPAIKAAGNKYGPVNPQMLGAYVPHAANALREGVARLAGGTPQMAVAAAQGGTDMKASELNPPRLGISRQAPTSVGPGTQFTYVIFFANHGDTDATDVSVGMQVPFRTQFVSTQHAFVKGTSLTPIAPPTTTFRTNKAVIQDTGGGVDIVTWHIPTLPAQSIGQVELVVKCDRRFSDQPIQDHSAYISAANAGTTHVAADDLVTWIYGKSLNESKIKAAQAFFESQGVTVTPQLVPIIGKVASSLGPNSRVRAFGGLDSLHLIRLGVNIIPIGKDQVLCISNDGNSIISQDGGSIISQDGGSVVAQGAGNAISVKNISSSDSSISGTRDCAYLLDHAPAVVAAGAGNLVSSGAGNLVTDNGSGLVSNHPGGGIIANLSQFAGSAIQADGSRIISQDGGSLLGSGSPLISPNGAGVVSNDGNSIISQDGGSVISTDGSSVISPNGAGLTTFSHGGGLIGEHGAGINSH